MARSKDTGDYAALLSDYREWLKREGMTDDNAAKAVYAARSTNYGKHGHCGYTEKGINVALGGDPYLMD